MGGLVKISPPTFLVPSGFSPDTLNTHHNESDDCIKHSIFADFGIFKGGRDMIKSSQALFLMVFAFAVSPNATVQGQDSAPYQAWRGYSEGETGPEISPGVIGAHTLSDWIVRPGQGGNKEGVGLNGPIGWEIYTMTGLSFPVSNGALAKNLMVGWDITGGGRTLFFNQEATKAWVVDIGISNVFQTAKNREPVANVVNYGRQNFDNSFNPSLNDFKTYGSYTGPVVVKYVNRTSANLAVGREWYLWGSAEEENRNVNFRFGLDVGGRWGSMKMQPDSTPTNPNQVTFQTVGFGALFGAVHADLEIPWHGIILQNGLRLELDQNWNSVLQQQNNANILSLNLLYRFGIRF